MYGILEKNERLAAKMPYKVRQNDGMENGKE